MNNLLTMLLLPVIASGVGATVSKDIPKECYDNKVSYVFSADTANEMSAKFDEAINRAVSSSEREKLVQNINREEANNVIRQDRITDNGLNQKTGRSDATPRVRRSRTDIRSNRQTQNIDNTNILENTQSGTIASTTNNADTDSLRRAIDNANDVTGNSKINSKSNRNTVINRRNRSFNGVEDNDSKTILDKDTSTNNQTNGTTNRNARNHTTNFSNEINQLNSEFSRMFELAEELSNDRLERLPKKLEFEALKREYIIKLSDMLHNKNTTNNTNSNKVGEDLIFRGTENVASKQSNISRNSDGVRQDALSGTTGNTVMQNNSNRAINTTNSNKNRNIRNNRENAIDNNGVYNNSRRTNRQNNNASRFENNNYANLKDTTSYSDLDNANMIKPQYHNDYNGIARHNTRLGLDYNSMANQYGYNDKNDRYANYDIYGNSNISSYYDNNDMTDLYGNYRYNMYRGNRYNNLYDYSSNGNAFDNYNSSRNTLDNRNNYNGYNAYNGQNYYNDNGYNNVNMFGRYDNYYGYNDNINNKGFNGYNLRGTYENNPYYFGLIRNNQYEINDGRMHPLGQSRNQNRINNKTSQIYF